MNHRMLATALALALLLATPALAGTADDPELTDPGGDVAREEGDLVGTPLVDPIDFTDVDLLKAWVAETAEGVVLVVETNATPEDTTNITVGFAIEAGPQSAAGSTANGTTYTMSAEGGALTVGPDGAEATTAGNLTFFNFTMDAVGASPGDVLAGLNITAMRSDEGGTDLEADDQSGSDTAPGDEGTVRPYTFAVDDVVAAIAIEVVSFTLTSDEGDGSEDRDVSGTTVDTKDGDATATIELAIVNQGSGQDEITLSADGDAVATLGAGTFTLAAGASETTTLDVDLGGAEPGTYEVTVTATSTAGGTDDLTFGFTVLDENAPAPTTTGSPTTSPPVTDDAGRDPVIGDPLTGPAEAMGLDEAFGDWAEVVLLAIILLVILLVVFLILFLARRQWLVIRLKPANGVAAPGETAEFELEIQNRKKRAYATRLHFESDDPAWSTGVLVTQEDGATLDPLLDTEQELEFTLNGKGDPGDSYHGTVRVKVPEAAADREQARVTLGIVPVDEEGDERRKKARFAAIKVQSDVNAATPPPEVEPHVRLSGVQHEPIDPQPGEQVTTRASVENDDLDRTWVLRMVLNVDGADVQEQVVAVPPRKARAVIFTWTATEADNRVRVQVFLKDQ